MPAKQLTEANCHPRYWEIGKLTHVWYLLILEFKSTKLNLILLPQLLCAVHKVSDSLHLSKTMAQRTQNASL